jgi:hypothetical protein
MVSSSLTFAMACSGIFTPKSDSFSLKLVANPRSGVSPQLASWTVFRGISRRTTSTVIVS